MWKWVMVTVLALMGLLAPTAHAQAINDVRLVNAKQQREMTEGLLEVFIGGPDVWTHLCNDYFQNDDASVACRTLGYAGGAKISSGLIPEKNDSAWRGHLKCQGDEATLDGCSKADFEEVKSCSKPQRAAVMCFNYTVELEVINTEAQRVEIDMDGQKRAACAKGFDNNEAKVICKSKGYKDGITIHSVAQHLPRLESNETFQWFSCRGTEKSLQACRRSGYHENFINGKNCDEAYVACYHQDALVTDVQLVNTKKKAHTVEGLLDVFISGPNVWTKVCIDNNEIDSFYIYQKDSFYNIDGLVACRSLGYEGGEMIKLGWTLHNDASVWTGPFKCSGYETTLSDCPWAKPVNVERCRTPQRVALRCFEHSVELRGNKTAAQRVEIYADGETRAVCDRGFSDEAARVVCRSRGYRDGVTIHDVIQRLPLLNSDGFVSFKCRGTEQILQQCPHSGHHQNAIDGTFCKEAYVACNDIYSEHFSVDLEGDSATTGRVLISHKYGYPRTVCDRGFPHKAVRVVCRSKGYADGMTVSNVTQRLKPLITRAYARFICKGTEQFLQECQNSGYHKDVIDGTVCKDAYITCYNQDVEITDVRLENATKQEEVTEGLLEVFISGPNVWTYLCNDDFGNSDAFVACKKLGYVEGEKILSGLVPEKNHTAWRGNLKCHGDEATLAECRSADLDNIRPCLTPQRAAVKCYATPKRVQSTDDDNSNQTVAIAVGVTVPVVVLSVIIVLLVLWRKGLFSGTVSSLRVQFSNDINNPTVDIRDQAQETNVDNGFEVISLDPLSQPGETGLHQPQYTR